MAITLPLKLAVSASPSSLHRGNVPDGDRDGQVVRGQSSDRRQRAPRWRRAERHEEDGRRRQGRVQGAADQDRQDHRHGHQAELQDDDSSVTVSKPRSLDCGRARKLLLLALPVVELLDAADHADARQKAILPERG